MVLKKLGRLCSYLLDEPFTALESSGKAIVISSNNSGDVEQLCHRVAIITEGKILAERVLSPGIRMLTKRELEILKLLAHSKSNKEIAEELYMSEETVKSHIKGIFRKLGIKSRAEAVSYFRQRD